METTQQVLHKEVAEGNTPAVSYIFFNNQSVLYEHYEGHADVRNNVQLTPEHTFNGFSVTKTFTALAVLQLEERGLLHLQDPVKKYLPDFPYDTDITIQQLLNHTAGLPNPIPLKWIHLAEEHDTFNRDAYFEPVFRKNNKLKSTPGEEFNYSNLGYIILGQVIEKVSAERYEDYITYNILNKVATPSVLSFTINPELQAKGYQKKYSFMNFMLNFLLDKKQFMGPSEKRWKPFRFTYMNGAAYGGLIVNARGMAEYGQAILNNDLIGGESRIKYFTENRTLDGKLTGMSLSWFTGSLNGHRYYHHAGGGGGYYVEFRLYPDVNCGSVVIFNRSGMTDERLLDKADAGFIGR